MTLSEPPPALRLVAVHAGRGPTSASRRLAQLLVGEIRDLAAVRVKVSVVDVVAMECAADLRDDALRTARTAIATADAAIAVSPIVHGAYSGPFKSFVDLMGMSVWAAKPVVIAACGGTTRHSLALEHVMRPLFVCLRCVVMPTSVFAAADECGPGGPPVGLSTRITRAARELLAAAAERREPVGAIRGA